MEYVEIKVPEMNDSLSRLVLNGKPYQIRFTYNDTADYWKFSLYTSQYEPIVVGIKIVPQYPLNVFYPVTKLPDGIFGVFSKNQRVGKRDFADGNAKFVFAPVDLEIN